MTNDIGEEVKILLFVLIVIVNAVFVFLWLIGILEAYAIRLSDKYPRIAKLLCF